MIVVKEALYLHKVGTTAKILNFFSSQLWEIVAFLVSNVPMPTPGKERVFFTIENSLLVIDVPPKDGLPHADVCNFLPFPPGSSPQHYIYCLLP